VETAKVLYQELIHCTRQEAGCIAYDLGQSMREPRDFALIEHWTGQDALTAHQQTEHFRRIAPQLAAMSEAEQTALYRTVDI
jgi:quinol monooxygenase YgiN